MESIEALRTYSIQRGPKMVIENFVERVIELKRTVETGDSFDVLADHDRDFIISTLDSFIDKLKTMAKQYPLVVCKPSCLAFKNSNRTTMGCHITLGTLIHKMESWSFFLKMGKYAVSIPKN